MARYVVTYETGTDVWDINGSAPATNPIGGGTGVNSVAKSGGAMIFGDVTLSEGSNITITESGNDLQIAASGGGGGGGYIGFVVVQDEKTVNTAGGTFTTGAYRTRDLNTVALDSNSDVSLSSNQLTFAAGVYDCEIVCPAFHVNQHKARLRNVTDSVTLLVGTSEWQDQTDPGTQGHSFIAGRFTIGASKAVEVQHACSVTQATNGFGVQANLTEVELYTVARFFRVS